jgi:plasmid maintenance system antidote protein VapI
MQMQTQYQALVEHFGSQEAAANALQVKQCTISGYVNGKWQMSEKVAARAQKVTNGKFKASDLCSSLKEIEQLYT